MKKTVITLTALATLTGVVWGINSPTKDGELKVEASQGENIEMTRFQPTSTIKGTKIISAKTINKLFETKTESDLKGLGETVYKVSVENGIEPGFVAGLIYYETNKGTSKAFKENNNAFGILENGSNKIKKFNSVEESLNYGVERLRKNYLELGLDNIEKFGNTYAPFWNKFNEKPFGEVYADIMNEELDIQK
ncbi:glucosaminidase domain-containing protein [Bacillus bombysepticus]|uniref:glucosaminidase domain-containing protein n=1 Tax=Bacillus bombysepticus TaxID=658666 RepID=UPI003016B919